MAKGTYVPNYSTGHVDTHSRHACARDGDATERVGHSSTIPHRNPCSATELGRSRGRTGGRASASAPRVAVEGVQHLVHPLTVRYASEWPERTLWHTDTVRGVGTGGLRPPRPVQSRRESKAPSQAAPGGRTT
eukprot:6196715-Pleurochrysis_carterae.AAC.5